MIAVAALAALGAYLAIGLIFALPFLVLGARRIDPAARGASVVTRLLWLPGTLALWPLLLLKWLRARPKQEHPA